MTGSSEFDLMSTRYVAGLIDGRSAPSSARWTARRARLAGGFGRSLPAALFEAAIAIMARRRS